MVVDFLFINNELKSEVTFEGLSRPGDNADVENSGRGNSQPTLQFLFSGSCESPSSKRDGYIQYL